ncbi:hypothetical protein ACRAWF_15485 [Streptomyces sp. L7]
MTAAESSPVPSATARTHLQRAMPKLGARDRARLVGFADQTSLVRPESLVP